jgi:hypothetical protein
MCSGKNFIVREHGCRWIIKLFTGEIKFFTEQRYFGEFEALEDQKRKGKPVIPTAK